MNPNEALQKAISVAGGAAALARSLGISTQAVAQWPRVPADRCIAVEAATGVSKHDMRPDVFGPREAA